MHTRSRQSLSLMGKLSHSTVLVLSIEHPLYVHNISVHLALPRGSNICTWHRGSASTSTWIVSKTYCTCTDGMSSKRANDWVKENFIFRTPMRLAHWKIPAAL